MSYNDIISLNDNRAYYLKMFENMIKDIPDSIYKNYKPLFIMLNEMELLEEHCFSEYVFPREKVNFYPNLSIVKTKTDFICPVSFSKVFSGSECVKYKPFIYLPYKKETYVISKAIKASTYYEDFFPTDIKTFDDFVYKINNSYDLDLKEYYNFNSIYGDILLRKLSK